MSPGLRVGPGGWLRGCACGLLALIVLGCRSGGPGGEPAPTAPAQSGQPIANTPKLAEPAPSEAAEKPAPVPEPTPAPAPAAAPTLAEALAYDPADPLKDLEQADAIAAPPAPAAELTGPCRWLVPPQRVWSTPGQLAVASAGGDFVVAGYARGQAASEGERVFVVRMSEQGLPKPLRTVPIVPPHPGPRRAGPGLSARDGNHVTLAVTDGAGGLSVGDIRLGGASAATRLRPVATGVDTRFAPAVDHVDAGTLVAYTEGSTPMRTHVALIPADAQPPTITNVTPAHVGATAPTFVAGAQPPKLYVVDARDGMSPLLQVTIDMQGVPRPGEIVVPVGMVRSPTQLAAARTIFGTALVYVGMGSAATTAVGLIDVAPKPGAPTALVKGTAYGPLSVAAASAPDALYFAADAPRQPGEKAPKRELHVVRVGEGGLQERTVIQGPGGDAYGVAMARNGAGTAALAFNASDGVYVARLRCR